MLFDAFIFVDDCSNGCLSVACPHHRVKEPWFRSPFACVLFYIIRVMQKQNKILLDERAKIQQELNTAKKQNNMFKNEMENRKESKEIEKEQKEMRDLKRNLEDYREDMKKATDNQKKEIEQLLAVIAEIEAKHKSLRNKYHKLKSHSNNKAKSKEEDIDMLKHTYNAQMISTKNEYKDKLKEMNNKIINLQGLLKEKISELDEEVRKRSENEDKAKSFSQTEAEFNRKINSLKEKLKDFHKSLIVPKMSMRN